VGVETLRIQFRQCTPRAARNNLVIFNADPRGSAPHKFIITKCKVCFCYDNRKKRGELIEWDTRTGVAAFKSDLNQ